MNQKYEEIIRLLGKDRVREGEHLAQYTTFKIGGPADLFYETKTEKELIGVLRAVRELGIPYFVLGGGSNILVGDKGFRGLIIKLSNCELKIAKDTILAGAGVPIIVLLDECRKNSLTGLEFMAGIPGTVGGSVRGNAGAWQQSISERVSRVKTLFSSGEIKWLEQKDCSFAYRDSRFKKSDEVILAVELRVEKGDRGKIEKRIKEYLDKREDQPREPSGGCIFVNPKPKSAGGLIDECGLKGTRAGSAKISEKHANFIVNTNGAKAIEVVELIDLARRNVKEKFRVELKEEIVRMGEF